MSEKQAKRNRRDKRDVPPNVQDVILDAHRKASEALGGSLAVERKLKTLELRLASLEGTRRRHRLRDLALGSAAVLAYTWLITRLIVLAVTNG